MVAHADEAESIFSNSEQRQCPRGGESVGAFGNNRFECGNERLRGLAHLCDVCLLQLSEVLLRSNPRGLRVFSCGSISR